MSHSSYWWSRCFIGLKENGPNLNKGPITTSAHVWASIKLPNYLNPNEFPFIGVMILINVKNGILNYSLKRIDFYGFVEITTYIYIYQKHDRWANYYVK